MSAIYLRECFILAERIYFGPKFMVFRAPFPQQYKRQPVPPLSALISTPARGPIKYTNLSTITQYIAKIQWFIDLAPPIIMWTVPSPGWISSESRGPTCMDENIRNHRCSISDTLLRFQTRATQRRLASKIQAKFRTFLVDPVKIGNAWAKCLVFSTRTWGWDQTGMLQMQKCKMQEWNYRGDQINR